MLGPFTLTTAPAFELAEGGEWLGVYPARNIEVLLLADFADSALSGIEQLDEGLANCVRFATENPHFFPLATALVEYATAWAGVQGDRYAGCVTAEKMILDQEEAPLLARRTKGPAKPKRRPTVAVYFVSDQFCQGPEIGSLSERGRLTPSVRVAFVWPVRPSRTEHMVFAWLFHGLAFPRSFGHGCSCKHTGRLKLGLGGWGRHQALGSTSTYTQHISEHAVVLMAPDVPLLWRSVPDLSGGGWRSCWELSWQCNSILLLRQSTVVG